MDKEKIKREHVKTVRNKGRDVIGDYYVTNRRYTKENEERIKAEGGGKKWSATEKIYITLIAVGLVLLFVKYVLLR